jgi:glycerol-3-phosphate dehydrogenase (NAD(P)+)
VATVTILGAGDMGTALTTPLVQNGHDVVLWGTERDEAIVDALRSGEPHPRLQVVLPRNVVVCSAIEADAALCEAEVVVVAITSDAVRPVLSRLAPSLGQPWAMVTVAKGFDAGLDGESIQLLPTTIGEFTSSPVVAVGGPSKANEVAQGLPTAVVFGSLDPDAMDLTRSLFETPDYRISTTSDVVGLEVAASMKNAYAIALGIADGLELQIGLPHHNLRAALFPIAVDEIGVLAGLLGGRAETAYGLAGAGDLLVTITSGRNRLLGERIGQGDSPAAAVRALAGRGTTIEGYAAVTFGHRLYREAVLAGTLQQGDLSLLDAIWRILHYDESPGAALREVLRSPYSSPVSWTPSES